MTPKLYLKELHIKNLGIIEHQEINFAANFNAIIGETGSGKSLILDAIELLTGCRGDKKLIRKNAPFLVVEGSFDTQDPEIKEFFYSAGFPFEEQITIKRIIYAEGGGKTYVNQQSSTNQFVRTFARKYVDLVGQFENQKLLSSEYQLRLTDLYGDYSQELAAYKQKFNQLKGLSENFNKIQKLEDEGQRRKEFIEFQLKQLQELKPSKQEEIELLSKKESIKARLQAREKFVCINHLFEGSDHKIGLLQLLGEIEKNIDPSALPSKDIDNFLTAKDLLEEFNFRVNLEQSTEPPTENLEEVIEKLNQYQKLKRKFNTDTEGLESTMHRLSDELEQIDNAKRDRLRIEQEISNLTQECLIQAEKIHQRRMATGEALSKSLTDAIRNLNMAGATIKVQVDKASELGTQGISTIVFLAETNIGEGYFQIRDVASGGELSRILLAVRNILAAKDSISIFLFDEIDAGIGGETALCVGSAIEQVATTSQVITITHLPQIAKFADQIIKVQKTSGENKDHNRTMVEVTAIQAKNIQKELSSMIPLS